MGGRLGSGCVETDQQVGGGQGGGVASEDADHVDGVADAPGPAAIITQERLPEQVSFIPPLEESRLLFPSAAGRPSLEAGPR